MTPYKKPSNVDETRWAQQSPYSACDDPASASWWANAEALGTLSHEMRGPLAAIKGYAATLLKHEQRLTHEEREEFLQAIGTASDRLTVIVEQLLALAQFETGAVRLERDEVDMASLTRQALSQMAEKAARMPKMRTFSLRAYDICGAPTTSTPLVNGDSRLLRALVDELLENAILHSPEGGVIEVTVRPIMADAADVEEPQTKAEGASTRAMLELSVYNSGPGIPDEHVRRIFDRFHRVDTSPTRETPGMGLGLTLCARIVELHGGAIWAVSGTTHGAEGGAVFFVRLPLASDLPVETKGAPREAATLS